jgi:hypothetical protein
MNRKQFEKERRKQIKELLAASTPAERRQIQVGRKAGRILRRQVERL